MCLQQMLSSKQDQAVRELIESFFQQGDKGIKDCQSKLVKLGQLYAQMQWQRKFVHLIFAIYKKSIKKDTFTTISKRFLSIIDELLEMDWKKQNLGGYRANISQAIVEYYTFIFTLIFEYRLLDLIAEFKVYRMLWAKNITDQAFDNLRTEIAKLFRNLDLNKGFSAQNLQRIKTRFSQKGFAEQEIARYLGGNRLENKRTEPSPSNQRRERQKIVRDQSSDDSRDNTRKRVKLDPMMHPQPMNQNYNMMQRPFQTRMNQGPAMPNQPYQYPPNIYQNNYPIMQGHPFTARPPPPQPLNQNSMFMMNMNPNQNNYNSYNRNYPPNVMPVQQMNYPPMPITPINPSMQNNYYGQTLSQPYGYQDSYNQSTRPPIGQFQRQPSAGQLTKTKPPPSIISQQSKQSYSNANKEYDFNTKSSYQSYDHCQQPAKSERKSSSGDSNVVPEKDRYKVILQKLKKGQTQCKQCGMLFISKDNLQKHQKQHFFQAQRKFIIKQAQTSANSAIQKQKYRYEPFYMLSQVKQWITGSSCSKQSTTNFQVSINGLPDGNRGVQRYYCFFCNEQLKLNWCEQLQTWSLQDGVKIEQEMRGVNVAHFDCYDCFRAGDNSFTNTSLLI